MISGVGVSQADIYQMLAYGVRYQCHDISLVYPKFLDQDVPLNYHFSIKNGEGTITVNVIQIDLEQEVGLLFGKGVEYHEKTTSL